MPQAVRLLCPWDRPVDARSAWPHVNFSQPQSSAYYPGKLISTNHQIDEVRESAVPTEHVRTGAVPAGLWPLLAFTHRLRGGLIKFRPRRGLDACLFEDKRARRVLVRGPLRAATVDQKPRLQEIVFLLEGRRKNQQGASRTAAEAK